MARVITFSRHFPSYHRRAGEPTLFVEKLWASLVDQQKEFPEFWPGWFNLNAMYPFYGNSFDSLIGKDHTIRAGKRWKVGDIFSPRIWSGKPYRSKMVVIAPDIVVAKVFDFEINNAGIVIDGIRIIDRNKLSVLAERDGLTLDDLLQWFKFPNRFSGQIICWNEAITY